MSQALPLSLSMISLAQGHSPKPGVSTDFGVIGGRWPFFPRDACGCGNAHCGTRHSESSRQSKWGKAGFSLGD